MRFATSTFALLVLAASPLFADMTITSKVTHDGGEPQTGISYVSSDRVRVSQPGGTEMMIDFASGDMTMIDNNKKQYWVMTQKDMDAMIAKMNEMMNSPEMKKAQEQMKNLPPEVQAKMQAMMGGMTEVHVEKTGTTRTIAGYKCENYTITIGTLSKSEDCMTEDLKFPTGTLAKYRDYEARMRSLMAAMGPMSKGLGNMMEEMKKIKGFPLSRNASTSIMGRTSTSTMEVTSVKEGAIPASAWAIPAGYTKTESPMQKMAARK